MSRARSLRTLGVVCAALAWFAGAAAAVAEISATVEGRWRLVEQTAGRGRAEHASGTPALRLALSRVGGTIGGETWLSGRESVRVEWPALFDGDRPVPVRVVERTLLAAGDRVVVRYEARDPADERTVLDITEDYRVAAGGAELVGTVTVRLRRDGSEAGEYVLRRRFERDR